MNKDKNKGKNKRKNKENKENNNESKNELTFKIITLGESGVGKTAILYQYITGKYDNNTISTLGVSFAL